MRKIKDGAEEPAVVSPEEVWRGVPAGQPHEGSSDGVVQKYFQVCWDAGRDS